MRPAPSKSGAIVRSSIHAQQRQRLRHAPRLERRRDHSLGAQVGRGNPGNCVQSRAARLHVAMTFSQSASGLTVTPSGSVRRCRGSPIRNWRRRSAFCGSPTTRAGSTTTIRARQLPDGFAKRPGHRRLQQRPHHQHDGRDTWTSTFTGTSVSVYAPKESGAGKIEIQIDGQTRRRRICPPRGRARPSRWWVR
jgi:hypothetical protein